MAKDALIKARVTPAMKQAIEVAAKERGESEAVIVREAIQAYFKEDGKAPASVAENAARYKVPKKKAV